MMMSLCIAERVSDKCSLSTLYALTRDVCTEGGGGMSSLV